MGSSTNSPCPCPWPAVGLLVLLLLIREAWWLGRALKSWLWDSAQKAAREPWCSPGGTPGAPCRDSTLGARDWHPSPHPWDPARLTPAAHQACRVGTSDHSKHNWQPTGLDPAMPFSASCLLPPQSESGLEVGAGRPHRAMLGLSPPPAGAHPAPHPPTFPAHLRLPTRPCSRRWSWALSRRRLSSLVNVPSECRTALGMGQRGSGGSGSRGARLSDAAHLGGAGCALGPPSSSSSSSSSTNCSHGAMVGAMLGAGPLESAPRFIGALAPQSPDASTEWEGQGRPPAVTTASCLLSLCLGEEWCDRVGAGALGCGHQLALGQDKGTLLHRAGGLDVQAGVAGLPGDPSNSAPGPEPPRHGGLGKVGLGVEQKRKTPPDYQSETLRPSLMRPS